MSDLIREFLSCFVRDVLCEAVEHFARKQKAGKQVQKQKQLLRRTLQTQCGPDGYCKTKLLMAAVRLNKKRTRDLLQAIGAQQAPHADAWRLKTPD